MFALFEHIIQDYGATRLWHIASSTNYNLMLYGVRYYEELVNIKFKRSDILFLVSCSLYWFCFVHEF